MPMLRRHLALVGLLLPALGSGVAAASTAGRSVVPGHSSVARTGPVPGTLPEPAPLHAAPASAMPTGDLPGWHQVLADDFTTAVAMGDFPGSVYGGRWSVYKDGWKDTTGHGTYMPSRVLSVHDGNLDMWLRTEHGVHEVAAPVSVVTQPYGRYSERFRADSIPGYKTAWLLWPTSGVSPRDGEIDFPEGNLDSTFSAYAHYANPSGGQDAFPTGATYGTWHIATTVWAPGWIRFMLDGKTVGTSTTQVPSTPMKWVLQTETSTSGGAPPDGAAGHVYVDWAVQYARAAASPSPTATSTSPSSSPTPSPSSTAGGKVTKLLTVFEENHTLAQMQAGMPYLNGLARRYGTATNYTALSHPSLPNYLAVTGGSTFGITDDSDPSSHPISGQSIFGQAIAAGRSAKVYAESQGSTNCLTGNSGLYAVRHTGWPYFVDERSSCRALQVESGETSGNFSSDAAAGRLPNAGYLIPNLCNDAHHGGCDDPNAGSVTLADNWLKKMLPLVFAGPDWRAGRLAVVVTADEDDGSGDNKVLTVVIHPSVKGRVVTTALNHYGLSRSYSYLVGATPLRQAAGATNLLTAFGVPVG